MELKALRSFLAVAQDESMTRAAERLHVTQPTLSKQIRALEDELGKKLFERHSFSLSLTAEGQLLREHARDVVSMADKIAEEFTALDNVTGGDLYFGLAESFQMRYLAQQVHALQQRCPDLRYHIVSGTTEQVLDRLDKGILDFTALAERPDPARYHALPFPEVDRWGVIMPEGCDLARREAVSFDDLVGLPLLCSDQGWRNDIPRWCGRRRMGRLTLAGSFGLSYNGSVFAREGLGYLLSFDRLVDTSPGSGLTFRPLTPPLETKLYLVWKRSRVMSPIAERFLEQIRGTFAE